MAKEAITFIKQVESDAVKLIEEAQVQAKQTILQVTEEVAAYEAKAKQETALIVEQEEKQLQQTVQEKEVQMTLQGDQMKEKLLVKSNQHFEQAVKAVVERIVK